MARLLCTMWALVLNNLGIWIFRTCFADAMEDEYGLLISSPAFTLFLITTTVYIIVVSSTVFPRAFRKPKPVFMCLYEFLVTAFFLEFAIACIWTPIDVLILTLPEKIYHMLKRFELKDAADMVYMYKSYMTIFTNGIATILFLTSLYVTRAVNFKEMDNGIIYFLRHLGTKLYQRIWNEFS